MKKLVTIGGGSGQSHLLQYLKEYPFQMTALVSMVDNGGSTGQLRDQLQILPPGDVRRCLTALARAPQPMVDMFTYRFERGELANHPLGNLILAGLTLQTGRFDRAVQLVSDWLHVQGTVLPITIQPSTLYAQLANGQVIVGETNIDVPQHSAKLRIKKIYLKPSVPVWPAARQAIQQADYIILSIGDLYTSLLPNLLVGGVAAALRRTKAKIIYTCNRVTKSGETRGFSVLDYVQTIDRYLGASRVDTVIVDRSVQRDGKTAHLVKYQRTELERYGVRVVEAALRGRDRQSIDGKKLAAVIAKLCR